MPTLEETQSAEKVRFLNDLALAATLRDHPAILIQAQDKPNWRPCEQTYVGVLEGLEHLGNLVPLCTDGTVAWFLRRIENLIHVKVGGSLLNENEKYSELIETTMIHGSIAQFQWSRGGRGAPPQPYVIRQGKAQKSGEKKERKESRPRTPSALDAALDLLRNLP